MILWERATTTTTGNVDSQVAVGAASKGTSSARKINKVLRKIAGLSLAYGIVLEYLWIATKFNPADAPSRGESLETWWAQVPEAPPPWSVQVEPMLEAWDDGS